MQPTKSREPLPIVGGVMEVGGAQKHRQRLLESCSALWGSRSSSAIPRKDQQHPYLCDPLGRSETLGWEHSEPNCCHLVGGATRDETQFSLVVRLPSLGLTGWTWLSRRTGGPPKLLTHCRPRHQPAPHPPHTAQWVKRTGKSADQADPRLRTCPYLTTL